MAEPIAVDRIEITVLVDNVTDSLSTTPSFVTREWVRLQRQGMKRTMGGALCCANHGLSLVVRAEVAGKSRTVLFDGGPVDYAVERNGTRLGVDFAAIEAMVLSLGFSRETPVGRQDAPFAGTPWRALPRRVRIDLLARE
jgi:7,8-dihydropterin-6-yl-methyl-4-(beta-D-ribofuranosyl)aminobenzene 5'-phosphate synthase